MPDEQIRPIVFSYHQDIDERLESLVEAVRFIDFHGLGFNPLRVIGRQSRMAYLDVAGALRDIFVAIYPELSDIPKMAKECQLVDRRTESGARRRATMITAIAQPVLLEARQTGLLKERDHISYSAIATFQQCPLKCAPNTAYGNCFWASRNGCRSTPCPSPRWLVMGTE